MSFKNSFFYIILWLLPKNLFSRLIGFLVSMRLPEKLALLVNRKFAARFKLNMSEASKKLEEYNNLQALFTRRLRPGTRKIEGSPQLIISPCDGFVSEAGRIENNLLMQIKDKSYSLDNLCGSTDIAQKFINGYYMTIYLSPRDYHRFHVPLNGYIKQTYYIPGTLWPVNNWAVATIKNLFCQNERIITLIESEYNKNMLAHIAVGACVVGKIKLAYCDLESNKKNQNKNLVHKFRVEKGQDLGVFMFGSTIVLLFEEKLIDRLLIHAPRPILMGQALARLA